MAINQEYIVGIGELLWDCFPSYRRIGGAPSNFAYHASQFGYKGLVISAIGHDQNGEDLIEELEKHNLSYHLERVDLPTGTVSVDMTVMNDPQYTINTDVAWSCIPFTKELVEIAHQCRAVCYGTLAQYGKESRQTIGWFLEAVPQNCYKIYDVNLRENLGVPLYDEETIASSMSKCNVLKVNIGELDYLAGLFHVANKNESVNNKAEAIIKMYSNIEILIVTMGTDGSWVFWGKESSFKNTPTVDVVDVVGAGDSFTGAFIGSLLNGKSISGAHKTAVIVSAYVCTQPDGMPVMPKGIESL